MQLHGDSTKGDVEKIREELPYLKQYKVVHIDNENSVNWAKDWEGVVDAIFLDTADLATQQVEGTGKTHDWGVSAEVVKEVNIPVILAGGLSSDNVKDAIQHVQPYGVDVNSGTKGNGGFKDYQKLKTFIDRAKRLHFPNSIRKQK